MTDIDLAAADPVAVVVSRLRASRKVGVELGLDPDSDTFAVDMADRIGDRNTAPYPRLIVADPPGGSNRGLRWLMAPAVQMEAIGDLNGRPGLAALRRILFVALQEVAAIPDTPVGPGEPVVTAVTADGSGGKVPLPNGQPRYLSTVILSIHPPVPVSEPVAAPAPVRAVSAPEPASEPVRAVTRTLTTGGRRDAMARRDTKPADS